jgi:NADH-quinone oxidoreductase subunit L
VIHVFSVGYMGEDQGYPRYFAYLNLFVFFMLTLVMGASFPIMFVGWEGVGFCSYILIGYWFTDREKADAGKKAFIVNRIGDSGFLIAMFLLFTTFGTLNFTEIFHAAPDTFVYGGGLVTAIALLLLLGATGKSAQIPLYVWLPDAMAGPTPVSALIHAATMVTAGVYMVARTSVLFALAPVGGLSVALIGGATALFAATIGLAQYDIKRVLAYSTISQLGYMFVGVGVGAYAAGIFHLMTHAFFKALLFLGSGAVIHSMHHALHHTHNHADPQDMRNMGGLKKFMPITWLTMWIATLAIAGIWPFAGFFSKDEIIWMAGARASGTYGPWFALIWVMALAAAMITAVYMTRLMIMTFHGENRTGQEEVRHLHESPWVMWVPLSILAVLSIFGGWINVPHDIQESFLGGFGLLPMTEWMHEWLHPVAGVATEIQATNAGEFAHSAPFGGGEVLWAVVSTLLALVVVVVTSRVVGGFKYVPATEADEDTGFKKVLFNKYYVDEIYDSIVVQPIVRASRFAWKVIDQGIVDGIVNGLGHFARAMGWIGSLFQTGSVNTYALFLAIGVLVILGVVAF